MKTLAPPYPFITRAEKARTLVAGTAALFTYGAGLACIFNPAALGLVASFTAASALSTQYDLSGFITPRKDPFQPALAKMTPLTRDQKQDALLLDMVRGVSLRMGLAETPPVYITTADALAPMIFPYGLRWLMKLNYFKHGMMSRVFGAEPNDGALITTREALQWGHPERHLRFIMAHEVAHLKTDRRDFAELAEIFMKRTTAALLWGCAGMAAFGTVGLGVPLAGVGVGLLGLPASSLLATPFMAMGGLLAVWAGGRVFTDYASRQREGRADRNALYITRDLQAAERVMVYLHQGPEPEKPAPAYKEIWSSHPTHKRRAQSLRESFGLVNGYAVPLAGNDNTPPRQAQNHAAPKL